MWGMPKAGRDRAGHATDKGCARSALIVVTQISYPTVFSACVASQGNPMARQTAVPSGLVQIGLRGETGSRISWTSDGPF